MTSECEKTERFEKVFKAALVLFENDEEATLSWMNHPVRGLGGKRPVDMLLSLKDTNVVLNLIGALEHGIFL
jgi:putative toxin-antitoxin system antitoxin component (TIGR02293 family)